MTTSLSIGHLEATYSERAPTPLWSALGMLLVESQEASMTLEFATL